MKQEKALAILKSGKNVFLTGSAGAGKTYVLNQYIKYLRDRKVRVAVTASTGIAATHMNGQTVHSWSGMGIKDEMSSGAIGELRDKKYLVKQIEETDVLILDEISMLHKKQLNLLNKILKSFKEPFLPFGGMQVVFSGDFFQLPPISREQEESRDKFAFMSEAWVEAELNVCYITEQHRQKDMSYNDILNQIRNRNISKESIYNLEQTIYNKSKKNIPTKLYTHNFDVDRVNTEYLEELNTDLYTFESKSKGNQHLIDSLKRSVLAPDVLELKIGAKVMFVKNNFEAGYSNGTLGEIIDFKENEEGELCPYVKLYNGRIIRANMDAWTVENEQGSPLATFEQIPLRLAWGVTIHKSQGMTLDAAEIDLSKSFENGQGYVALSRIKSLEGLILLGLNEMAFSVDDLAFKADQRFQELSEKVDATFSLDELKKEFIPFLRKCDGLIDERAIKVHKKKKEAKEMKISTYDQTKELVLKKMTLEEIVEERGLNRSTIIGHLEKLKAPELDISLYKPDELLPPLSEAIEKLRDKKDNFSEEGVVRLSALFNFYNKKYAYEDLRLARLFV